MANTSGTNGSAAAKTADSSEDVVETEVGTELSFVAAVFDSVDDAKSAYKELKEEKREGLIEIIDAAYVEKTDRSKIKVIDHNEWDVGAGIVAGGVTGSIIGIIAGAVLVPAAIGVLLGGVIAGIYEHETSFSQKELRKVADDLPVGTSALIAIVEDPYVAEVTEEVKRLGGKKTHSGSIPKSTAESLKSNHNNK